MGGQDKKRRKVENSEKSLRTAAQGTMSCTGLWDKTASSIVGTGSFARKNPTPPSFDCSGSSCFPPEGLGT